MVMTAIVVLSWTVQSSEIPGQLSRKKPAITSDQPTATPLAPTTTTVDSADFQTKLYNLINGYRADQKLSKLRVSEQLESSALLKSRDMVENQYWRHQDQQGRETWYFFNLVGYNFQLAGENLAFAAESPWQTFADWQASPTHNQQLLTSEYEDMGLSIDCQSYEEYAKGGCLVVLHLGKQ